MCRFPNREAGDPRNGSWKFFYFYSKEKGKPFVWISPFFIHMMYFTYSPRLTLGELEAGACCLAAVLLTFFDARVAGDETGLLKCTAQFRIGYE